MLEIRELEPSVPFRMMCSESLPAISHDEVLQSGPPIRMVVPSEDQERRYGAEGSLLRSTHAIYARKFPEMNTCTKSARNSRRMNTYAIAAVRSTCRINTCAKTGVGGPAFNLAESEIRPLGKFETRE